jgi:hypothetical protein
MQDATILSVAPIGTVTWKPNLERKLGIIEDPISVIKVLGLWYL